MKTTIGFTWGSIPASSPSGYPIALSQRQREVLLLLCEGLPNKLIGRQLGVSDNTVKSHVASLLRSLNVATRLEAVTVAFRFGLVRSCETQANTRLAGAGAALDLPRGLNSAVLAKAMHSPFRSAAFETNEGRSIS